jgi:uncharacterized protein (DUF2267 family)
MASHPVHDIEAFSRTERTAQDWVETVADQLGTEDLAFAHRVLRVWLHTVRDRLQVDAAAHFAAQLPLLLRGLFFEGWIPSQVPVKYDAEQFLVTVAQEARISIADARHAAAAVTAALHQRCSPGQLDHLLAQLPGHIRELLTSGAGAPVSERPGAAGVSHVAEAQRPDEAQGLDDARLARMERDIATIADAFRALLRGLEEHPSDEPQPQRLTEAAHRAHQMLLTLTPRP